MSVSDPLLALGWSDRWAPYVDANDTSVTPARVLRHDGSAVLVGGRHGTSHAHLRPATPPLAVGDWVLVSTDGVVVELLPRRSLLQRRDPSTGLDQPIAANVDVVAIVCGLDRPIRTGRIDRFITQTWDADAVPLVVLTKADLHDDPATAEAELVAAVPGAETHVVSSVTSEGIGDLRTRLHGVSVSFVGESGAGKSTLLNALAGEELARTGDVRAGDHKGRHITTARQLHTLQGPIWLIDTPGLREVGLWTDAETVDDVFDDVSALADRCRFRDCTHDTEPGCAVQEAVEAGLLPRARLDSWRKLRREAAAAELRADAYAYRQANRRFGRMVKEAMRHKRPDR